MFLEMGQRVRRPALELGIIPALGVSLEQRDRIPVRLELDLIVTLVEVLAALPAATAAADMRTDLPQVLDVEGLQAFNAHFHRALEGRPAPRATRQRNTEFSLIHALCRILDEPTAARCVGKIGASDGFRHVEN
jgi:hypothetical protein